MAKILIAEDAPQVAHIFQLGLEQAGYEVQVVYDGLAARDYLLRHSCDLAILDARMPKMDGLVLLREIRTSERIKSLPVLLITANVTIEEKLQGLAAGASAYLVKPLSIKEIIQQVQHYLPPAT